FAGRTLFAWLALVLAEILLLQSFACLARFTRFTKFAVFPLVAGIALFTLFTARLLARRTARQLELIVLLSVEIIRLFTRAVAACLLVFFLRAAIGDNPEIMVRKLQVILSLHTVAV